MSKAIDKLVSAGYTPAQAKLIAKTLTKGEREKDGSDNGHSVQPSDG